MRRMLVMTLIGEDRPGLVESVAGIIAERGGNWLESRMSRLGGQFAGILRVEVSAEAERPLIDSLKQLEARGLQFLVHPDSSPPANSTARLATLEIVGQDRPGIVQQISRALATHGVNVEELQSECSSAAMSGETLFKARARLSLPQSCDVSGLRNQLEQMASDLIVDIVLVELPLETI